MTPPTDYTSETVRELLEPAASYARHLPPWLLAIHWAIILNLVGQCVYGGWQVFVVMQPPGVIGPMFGKALDLPFELMMARRMYALESWVAFLGLALYLGVTEIHPRRRR